MTLRRPSLFGGSWINGSNAGSRYANLDNWPDNSDRNISARGRCDDPFPARPRSRPGLRFSKWSIQPASRGVNFLGYRIWATHKLLRRDSVKRARRKIAAMRASGDDERLNRFLAAWTGHASWADSRNLIASLGVTS